MNKRLTQLQKQQILKLYESGMSQARIGFELDIAQPTISCFLREKHESRKKHKANRKEPMRGPKPGYRRASTSDGLIYDSFEVCKWHCPCCGSGTNDDYYRLKFSDKTILRFCSEKCFKYYTSDIPDKVPNPVTLT